ncbi:MAG: YeeE/YedE family protein [Alphaproteobacteria bacterium]|nr:YeeE/YedE family protein [Alphaproteobacteria bacterium]
MIKRVGEFLVGLIFGFGLLLSGMTDTAKVIGFLNVTGAWDPSLAFVMGGAVLLSFFAFRVSRNWRSSLFGRVIILSDLKMIDMKLIIGSAIFGIGWGLSGFCPGPAIASLTSGEIKSFIFVAAMLIGMGLETLSQRMRQVA